jgi:hypothetical protein
MNGLSSNLLTPFGNPAVRMIRTRSFASPHYCGFAIYRTLIIINSYANYFDIVKGSNVFTTEKGLTAIKAVSPLFYWRPRDDSNVRPLP